MKLSRRQFAAWLGAGGVALAVGASALRASGYSVDPQVLAQLKVLRPWQYVVLSAFGRRVLAPEQVEVGLFADEYCAGLSPVDWRDMGRFLAYLEHVAPLGAGMPRRFSSLAPAEQDRVLEQVALSPVGLLRAGFNALKALSMMALYRQPSSWQALGYGGPIVPWGQP